MLERSISFILAVSISTLVFTPTSLFARKIINKKLDKNSYSLLNLHLWKSTEKDIFRKLGKTSSSNRKDPKHDPYQYCYIFTNQKQTLVTFDIGWATGFKRLTGFSIRYLDKNKINSKCRKVTNYSNPIITGNGISLDMEINKFKKLYPGVPTQHKGVLEYNYEVYTKYSKPKYSPFQNKKVFKVSGILDYTTVKAKFINKKLISYIILVNGESDFEIVDKPE